MINAIIESISAALKAEFGDRYGIYMEKKRQGFREPCFFILCLSPENCLIRNTRYRRTSRFCIHYFPSDGLHENRECNMVAERLFRCMEYVEVNGRPVRGTRMGYELNDGVLQFFVNYDIQVCRPTDSGPAMSEVSSETSVKGQVMK